MKAWLICVLGLALSGGVAGATTIGFGDLQVGTEVTNQYAGVTVSGGTVVSGSGSTGAELKNESGGAVLLEFSDLQSSVTGYYMSSQGVIVSAYGVGGNLLATATYGASAGHNSSWSIGLGSAPEAVISGVSIASAKGGEFKLDDVSYTYGPGAMAAETPEPSSLVLLGTGLFAAAAMCVYRASTLKGESDMEGGAAI